MLLSSFMVPGSLFLKGETQTQTFMSHVVIMLMKLYFCVSEYGAPEEGELKKQEPFALKNQLLS